MAGYIEDLWLTKKPDPKTGKRRRKATYGKGKRYRVKGIPAVRDRSFHKLSDAETWLKTAAVDSMRQEFVDPRDGAISLRDYVERHWWPNIGHGGTTLETMRYRVWNHILPHLGHLPLNAISAPELRAWLTTLRRDLSASTINGVWTYLSSIFAAAIDDGRLAKNPCRASKTVRPPTVTEKPARAWAQAVVDDVRAGVTERHRILLDLGVGCGLRQGEAFGVSPDDIVDGVLHVRRQVLRLDSRLCFGLPKGNKERRLPIPPNLEKRVLAHSERFPARAVTLPWLDPEKPGQARADMRQVTVLLLATTQRGNANNRSDWNELAWKPALEAAGLIKALEDPDAEPRPRGRKGGPRWEPSRDLGFHSLRHTFASVQLEAGESIVTLSHWLGHSSPTITLEHYAHFMPDAGARGLAAMDEWFA